MSISAADVKKLRDSTGAGMMDAKRALEEAEGDFEKATELLRIKRRAGRVIWLNPLLGNPSYEPLTRGMAAALPLVDHFAAAHNLAALRELADRLHL